MEKKGLYENYKQLLYSLLIFITGISILSKNGTGNFYGWSILSVSFGFLVTYFAQQVKTKKLKTGLNILSYLVPGAFIIMVIVYCLFR